MQDILIKNGCYAVGPDSVIKKMAASSNGIALKDYFRQWLGEGMCCAKDITADTLTVTTFVIAVGGVDTPSLYFAGDSNTGFYWIGANNIGVSANGAKVLDISTTGLGVVGTVLAGNGAVGTPSFSFTSDPDTGVYRVGANQLGFSAGGTLYATITSAGLNVDDINEKVTGTGVGINNAVVQKYTTFAVPASATVSAADFNKGYFTSTSAAAVLLTLDTAANIGTQLGAVAGTVFEFYVDNTAGANTVTVAVAAGITTATPVITGGSTLTVSVANAIGIFRLVFSSATVAKLYRIG